MVKLRTTREIATDPAGIQWLEKAEGGKVTLDDIQDALEEFSRLFTAGIASKAETLTLARAFPENRQYTEAASKYDDEEDPMVIGGPASIEMIDREGHLITTDALRRAFAKFMENFRTRNAMVLHSDVQVGWALPAYITRGGTIFRSGVDGNGLFFICEVRGDTKISDKVKEQIKEGRLKSYSIAGSATKVQNLHKGLVPYMQVDDMELAEVTVCEKGVNQGANFELLKAEMPQTGQINKDQCDYRDATPEESSRGENCGHCKFFNAEDKTCSVVSGDIQPGDWCKIFAPRKLMMDSAPHPKKVVVVMRDTSNVNFKKSFDMWMFEKAEKDPLKSKKQDATLQNFSGREAEHHQLLREFGFPSEQPSESSRYVPVIETLTDDKGVPMNVTPPWTVNEAGQDLGVKLDSDSPEYNKSDKAKNSKKAVQKMGYLFKAYPEEDLEKGPRDWIRRAAGRGKEQAPAYRDAPTAPPRPARPGYERGDLRGLSPRQQDADRRQKIQEARDREAGGGPGGRNLIPYNPAPGFVRGRAAEDIIRGEEAKQEGEAAQRRLEPSPEARRGKRLGDYEARQGRNRANLRGRVQPRERVDQRGAAGQPGQLNPNRADLDAQAEAERLQNLADLREQGYEERQAQRNPKEIAAIDSRKRREQAGQKPGFRERLQRQFGASGRQRMRRNVGQRLDAAGQKIDEGLGAAQRGYDAGQARVGQGVGRFARGAQAGYQGKGRLQERVGEKVPMEARAGRQAGKFVDRARRAGLGAFRGLRDRPDADGGPGWQARPGEGAAGRRGRAVGGAARKAYNWGAGNMPFFNEEAQAKRAEQKKFGGSEWLPGGWAKRGQNFDDHQREFKEHNDRVQTMGHDTHENFLHGLSRLGLTRDGGRFFTVRPGKDIGSKLKDPIHASDFANGMGSLYDIQIHPGMEPYADEIKAHIGEYMNHLHGAPGGRGTPNADVQPGGTGRPLPAVSQPAQQPLKVEELGSHQQALGGQQQGMQPALPATAQAAQMANAKQKQAEFLKKPTDQAAISASLDKRLKKMFGGSYAKRA